MSYPKNKEEWIDSLKLIIDSVLYNQDQVLYSNRFDPNNVKTKEQILEHVEKEEFQELVSYLNEIWWAAPDHQDIHGWPHWGQLCDLCSECECVVGYEEES